MRSMHIYTPPGYDTSTAKYPAFYLLHGGGDEDSGWSTIGRAGFIMDNLIAAKKAKPMIVVMPNGSMPRPANAGAPGTAGGAAAAATAQERFADELLKNVMPYVERTTACSRIVSSAPSPDFRWAAGKLFGSHRPTSTSSLTSACGAPVSIRNRRRISRSARTVL